MDRSIWNYVVQYNDLSQKKNYMVLWYCINVIIYNYCTSLSAIWCVMEHWKAILTKVEGRGQYCFSLLHNTSYCTKWSAVIVVLHLTFPILFCVLGYIFTDCLLFLFNFRNASADPFDIIDTCTNSMCTHLCY